jgi:glycosyltransferase involved in cell wall biosynthesis
MRVLFICSGTSKDGIGSIVLNQGESLRAQESDIDYFTISGKGFLSYFKHLFKLKSHLLKNSYHIIHAHYGLCGIIAAIARKRKTKLIISYMGADLLGGRKKNGEMVFSENLLVGVNQYFAKHADYVIVKSKEMFNKVHQINKSVIPNGVDLNKFNNCDKYFALKKVVWDPKFKHILFMSDKNRKDKNYKLLEAAMKHLKIANLHLHSIENVPHDKVQYFFNAADVCILTSYSEGSPNVIKEAMACNCPTVSTDVGDVREVFGNTEGYYISSFDPADVAEKIQLALEFAQAKGRTNGRERIIELGLDSETIAGKIISVYNAVLKIEN